MYDNLKRVEVKIKKLHPEAKIPVYGTAESAGFDIYSNEDAIINSGERKAVSTGIALEIPEGKVLLLWDRSGMGFKGIHRFAGVIDSDYRGEIKIILFNSTSKDFIIKKGDRIAQGIIQDYYSPEFQEIYSLTQTERGESGFGSSGK